MEKQVARKIVDGAVDGITDMLKDAVFSKPKIRREGSVTSLEYNIEVKKQKPSHWVVNGKVLCGAKVKGKKQGNPWMICKACGKILGKMMKRAERKRIDELIALMKQAGQSTAIAAMREYLHKETPGLTVANDPGPLSKTG